MTKFLAGLAAIGLAAAPVTAQTQETPPSADNPLDIPGNVQLLRDNDPNMRKATAVVNGAVITGTDVDHRVALVVATSQGEIGEQELIRLRMQVLRNLIDETLQIQEAAAQEIEIPNDQVEQRFARLAARNGTSVDDFNRTLLGMESSPASLKRQIRGEIAWSLLLRRNIAPFVNVSEEEVREVLERLEAARGTEEYRLGEIYLSATPENREAVMQNARRIVQQLQQGGSFVAYARQFSEASTAAVGGDLGFVRLATLPTEIAAVAREMQPGQLVGPVEIPGGFSILYLIDKQQVLTADPRDAVLSLKQISISFAPEITEAEASRRVDEFASAVSSMRGCGDAERVAAGIGAEVVINDQIRAAQLPAQLQSAILALQIGQTTPPFGSVEDGVRVLMLCGRDDPQPNNGPDFEQMMTRMEDERINKRAQRYLRDLRNDAYIEYN